MAAPNLSDYQYQFKDSGFLLNGPSTLPFVDIQKIDGLGMASYDPVINDIDGAHGSSIYVKYAKGRIVVIDGLLYASPTTIQTTIDTITANFLPDDVEYPFYFKQPGVSQRYVSGKSLGAKFDEDTLRRIGSCGIQIQIGCPYPVKRIDNATVTQTVFPASNVSIPNNGNTNSYVKYTVVGPWSILKFAYTQTNENQIITLQTPAIAGDTVVVDFRTKTVTKNGINISGQVTYGGGWWPVIPGTNAAATIELQAGGGTPTSVAVDSYSAWL